MNSPTPPPMLSITRIPRGFNVGFPGCKSLDEDNVETFGAEMDRLAADEPGCHICVDLGAIGFLSSSIVGKLLGIHRRIVTKGGRLILQNAQPAVLEVFTITQVD